MYSVQKYFFLTPSVIRPQSVNNQWANPLSAPTVFGPTPGINSFPESAGRNECETRWPYHARLGLPVQSSNSAVHVRRPAMAGEPRHFAYRLGVSRAGWSSVGLPAMVRQRLSSRGEVARAGQSLARSRSATRAKDPNPAANRARSLRTFRARAPVAAPYQASRCACPG